MLCGKQCATAPSEEDVILGLPWAPWIANCAFRRAAKGGSQRSKLRSWALRTEEDIKHRSRGLGDAILSRHYRGRGEEREIKFAFCTAVKLAAYVESYVKCTKLSNYTQTHRAPKLTELERYPKHDTGSNWCSTYFGTECEKICLYY